MPDIFLDSWDVWHAASNAIKARHRSRRSNAKCQIPPAKRAAQKKQQEEAKSEIVGRKLTRHTEQYSESSAQGLAPSIFKQARRA